MSDKVLKGCKRYIIKKVINPGLYWMTEYEYETEKCLRKKREDSDNLLPEDVEKYTGPEKIPVGELIAIKNGKGFQIGIITDIFNRNSETEFKVLLIECGSVIDVRQEGIYYIKNKEIRKKNLNIVRVCVKGIQPAAIGIEYDHNFFKGIFQKRMCQNWSLSAFKYVMDLVLKNPCVFVKPVKIDKSFIFGEIYFVPEPDTVPVCLSQSLCVKGFAMPCMLGPNLMIQDGVKGCSDIYMDEKIPDTALFREMQNSEIGEKLVMENMNVGGNNNLMNCSISPKQLHRARDMQSSSSTPLSGAISETEYLKPLHSLSSKSSSACYSSSWMLKKCLLNTSAPSSSCRALVDDFHTYEQSGPPKNAKFNIFRVIQRSMDCFEKQKQLERFHHN